MVEILSLASASAAIHHFPLAAHVAQYPYHWPAAAAANPYGPYPCCICEAINETLWFAWNVVTCPVHFLCPCFCGPMVAMSVMSQFKEDDHKKTDIVYSPLNNLSSDLPSLLDADDGAEED